MHETTLWDTQRKIRKDYPICRMGKMYAIELDNDFHFIIVHILHTLSCIHNRVILSIQKARLNARYKHNSRLKRN